MGYVNKETLVQLKEDDLSFIQMPSNKDLCRWKIKEDKNRDNSVMPISASVGTYSVSNQLKVGSIEMNMFDKDVDGDVVMSDNNSNNNNDHIDAIMEEIKP